MVGDEIIKYNNTATNVEEITSFVAFFNPSSSHMIEARSIIHAVIMMGKNRAALAILKSNLYPITAEICMSKITKMTTAEILGTNNKFNFDSNVRKTSPHKIMAIKLIKIQWEKICRWRLFLLPKISAPCLIIRII